MTESVEIIRGSEPLLVSLPHAGTVIPSEIEAQLVSPWLALKDNDWWIERLYGFAAGLGATVVRATHARSVIDVNREPSGASLYPGELTPGLCPTETFDGEPLYRSSEVPDEDEIERRRRRYYDPFHAALSEELRRLRQTHGRVVLYDAHAIRSVIPRLFEGTLPEMNIGTNSGASCDATFAHVMQAVCDASGFSWSMNARLRGGWITRHYGQPERDIHVLQMELACRAYLDEPVAGVDPLNWPPPYDPVRAAKMRKTLKTALKTCLSFARRAPLERSISG